MKKPRISPFLFSGVVFILAVVFGTFPLTTLQGATVTQLTADLALTTFVTPYFSGSGNCAVCHSRLQDAAGTDVSMDSDWRSTMMSNGAKDPLWNAKAHAETLQNPQIAALIEKKCATCHMPMAKTQAAADGTVIGIFGTGFLDPQNLLHEAAMDGISCTLCHQVMDTNFGLPDSFSGGYLIDVVTQKPDRLIYGPFLNMFQQPMIGNAGYVPLNGPRMTGSELCATCHTLFTPTLDADGNIVGELPEQTPYLEWLNSSYGDGLGTDDRTCQDCHMPFAVGDVKISNRPRNLPLHSPFGKHFFVGGNTFMLNVLKTHAAEIGVTATDAQLDATIARTGDLMQNDAGRITVAGVVQNGGSAEVTVNVLNDTGHKFPTGFPSRRTWIHLTVTDGVGAVVFESGKPLNDGTIDGNIGDIDTLAYEPHYQVIDAQDKVQIYEAIMENTDGAVTYTLLRGADYIKDNRLLPLGFVETPDIAVKGAAALDGDFAGGTDTLIYICNTAGHTGPFTVTARLLYQTVAYGFMKDMVDNNPGSSYVATFNGYFTAADKTPVLVSTAEAGF